MRGFQGRQTGPEIRRRLLSPRVTTSDASAMSFQSCLEAEDRHAGYRNDTRQLEVTYLCVRKTTQSQLGSGMNIRQSVLMDDEGRGDQHIGAACDWGDGRGDKLGSRARRRANGAGRIDARQRAATSHEREAPLSLLFLGRGPAELCRARQRNATIPICRLGARR